ncbi:hypothetical protein HW114_06480 [Serratia symbiotica]|uniref:Uncharacterized protein n=1 Tax=Serratia symbiotica TaxID=138074 RepID=A0A068Z8K4_9GAMM|nr:hypothetical protein [Serratia symbiotica]QLH62390.1 hypothetical protein SYMBAF_04835 [Serratia symbiotica]CDS58555.1 hypothetical protein SYMBAF_70046 [Serratia symbiotica]
MSRFNLYERLSGLRQPRTVHYRAINRVLAVQMALFKYHAGVQAIDFQLQVVPGISLVGAVEGDFLSGVYHIIK